MTARDEQRAEDLLSGDGEAPAVAKWWRERFAEAGLSIVGTAELERLRLAERLADVLFEDGDSHLSFLRHEGWALLDAYRAAKGGS